MVNTRWQESKATEFILIKSRVEQECPEFSRRVKNDLGSQVFRVIILEPRSHCVAEMSLEKMPFDIVKKIEVRERRLSLD